MFARRCLSFPLPWHAFKDCLWHRTAPGFRLQIPSLHFAIKSRVCDYVSTTKKLRNNMSNFLLSVRNQGLYSKRNLSLKDDSILGECYIFCMPITFNNPLKACFSNDK